VLNHQRVPLGAACVLGALLFTSSARDARACAPAWHGDAQVQVADESALVVWDAAVKKEHLIRIATFEGMPSSFGFLVPVPTTPELATADESVFDSLERFWEARRPVETEHDFAGFGSLFGTKSAAPELSAASVQVVTTQRVGGMDAAVLEANSVNAVSEWLRENDFDYRTQLVDWLTPYIQASYKIVAFKYAKDAGTPRVGSRAVRISFSTPRPFFPYREPADASRVGDQRFRLYAVADTSLLAKVGGSPGEWSANVRYSGPLRGIDLPFSRIAEPWGTFFEESAAKRSGNGDLYLEATPRQRLVTATPRTERSEVVIPLELLFGLLVAGVAGVLFVRRQREPDEEESEA